MSLGPFAVKGWRCEPSAAPAQLVEVMRFAMSHVGEYERPAGSNRSELIDKWCTAAGIPLASPWCAAFVSAAYALTDPRLMPRLGSAYKIREWARRTGKLLPEGAALQAGDIAGVVRADFHGHVGIYSADLGDGQHAFIEGNLRSACRGTIHPRGDWQWYARPLA